MFKMPNKINLNIKNFGPINEANININKINVVGGKNASGKSFSSKLLFCFLTSMSDKGKFIENNGIYGSFLMFKNRWIDNSSSEQIRYGDAELKGKLNSLLQEWDTEEISFDYFNNFFINFKTIIEQYGLLNDEFCQQELDSIKKGIEVNKGEFAYLSRVINFLLMAEFGNASLQSFSGAEIKFIDTINKMFDFTINFDADVVNLKFSANDIDKLKIKKVIYVDNIQILGFNIQNTPSGMIINNNSAGSYHFVSLLENLVQKDSIGSQAYEKVYGQHGKKFANSLIDLMGGSFEFDESKSTFTFNMEQNSFDIVNIASGYKQIGLIQLLLSNKSISDGTWLILDEPEVNLHPGMQIELAKLLVQIAKELNVKIYLNSHSPFIIEAIEVFSKKEKMEDEVSFFLTDSVNDNANKFNLFEVNRDNLNQVYDNLADPYHVLNSIRFEIDWENEFE